MSLAAAFTITIVGAILTMVALYPFILWFIVNFTGKK